MRKIIITLSLFFASIFSYGQPQRYLRNDSLVIKINRSFYISGNTEISKRNIKTEINFDFRDQYPFYSINIKQFGRNNKLIIEYLKIPQSGYLYFFTKNKDGEFDDINTIECGDFTKTNPISLSIIRNKIEYINLWYTKEKLSDFNNELEKLHYTNGNFIHRTTNFLNNNLNLPKNDWNFLENNIGIEFDSASTNNKLITPIIIKIK